MNREKTRAIGGRGEFHWRSRLAGFGIETEPVNPFAGIRRGVSADVNGVLLSIHGEGGKECDGCDNSSHGVQGLELGKAEMAMPNFNPNTRDSPGFKAGKSEDLESDR